MRAIGSLTVHTPSFQASPNEDLGNGNSSSVIHNPPDAGSSKSLWQRASATAAGGLGFSLNERGDDEPDGFIHVETGVHRTWKVCSILHRPYAEKMVTHGQGEGLEYSNRDHLAAFSPQGKSKSLGDRRHPVPTCHQCLRTFWHLELTHDPSAFRHIRLTSIAYDKQNLCVVALSRNYTNKLSQDVMLLVFRCDGAPFGFEFHGALR